MTSMFIFFWLWWHCSSGPSRPIG